MKLYVDDMRSLPEDDPDCICSRDYEDAIWQLSIREYEYISLDYDLGTSSLGNGLDILKWMSANGKYIPKINIHSSHPIGVHMMKEFAENFFPSSVVTVHSLY